ncbi:MAG: DUF3131 domain-containing protein, partial [Oscillospiraceae bacterium]|nr:DUF3131 domain-containing protein [Oscillospiraceae bacterium]
MAGRNVISTRDCITALRRALQAMRRQYSRSIKNPPVFKGREWLLDNYYLLAREGATALKALHVCPALPADGAGNPRLLSFFANYISKFCEVNTYSLAGALADFSLTAAETEHLQLFWCVSLLLSASHSACGAKPDAKALGYAVKSLRDLAEVDFEALAQNLCAVDAIFCDDPAGIYTQMDESTRADYRRRAAKAAAKHGCDEVVYAKQLLEKARAENRHIGFYLEQEDRRARGILSLFLEGVFPLLIAAFLAFILRKWWLLPILFLPLWEALRVALERLSLRGVPPTEFFRMAPDSTAVKSRKTLIVLSTLLPEVKKIRALEKRLMDLWHANGAENIRVCALMDYKGADTPEQPGDVTSVKKLRRLFARLEREAHGAFYLALRPRKWCHTQSDFSGWERKRGATLDLIRAAGGNENGFSLLLGEREFLRCCDSFLALDADTELPFGAARDFATVAAHPLNMPVIDEQQQRVVSGYGILAPRVLCRRGETPFACLLGGSGGFSAYDSLASERYQDLFGASIFAGKGLIDVKAAAALLPNAFPEGRVLSHDIIEGGLLRCGYVSSLIVADSFPKRAVAYFARLSRWVRGDVQNLPEIFRGAKSTLPDMTKWQLADNLRRAVTPIIGLFCVLLSLLTPMPTAIALLVVGLLSACGGELFSVFAALLRRFVCLITGCSTGGRSPALSAFSRAALAVLMLPQTAWTCLTAIFRAFWRMCVSKKNLLEWQTAAQSEYAFSQTLPVGVILPSIFIATPMFIFGTLAAKLVGLAFLCYPPFAYLSKRELGKNLPVLGQTQTETVQSYAAAAWHYFEEYANAANNYLPPDNVQETPTFAVAARTSPTNIGLYLLSCLAARDMGLIDSAELVEHLDKSLISIEKLERRHGHLLNWYNTTTLAPLHPRYISTVDSGNFLCAVTALVEGLREYTSEEPALSAILPRLSALTEDCDLAFLYNARRRLFSIGYDLEREALSSSYYDLFMSEARMTGYYAIAKGLVPRKHWGALGRLLARDAGRTGALSWTGTMFEYFMPQLFLPAPSGSFTHESLAFCLAQQQKRSRKAYYPWGISESGFFAFDPALNYQYKAHGVQKLGLKRGLDSELVISPYSSFLVLPYAPKAALSNLRKLGKMGMTGQCGFYEAADFTPSRTGGQDYAVVRSYMAHHVGMSFLACLNALQGNILQKRFLRNPAMGGAKSLLQEASPEGAPLFKDAAQREIPHPRERTQSEIRVYREPNPADPHAQILTNGEYTSVLADTGAGTALYGGVNVTRHSADLLAKPCGVFARFVYGAESLPFVRMLGEAKGCRFRTEFAHDSITYAARNHALRMTCRASVHPRLSAEMRAYKIKNTTNAELRGELRLYLEPSLIAQHREDEHPAFAKLFVTEQYDAEHRAMIFIRNPRGKEPTLTLAVGLAGEWHYRHAFERSRFVDSRGYAGLLCDTGAFAPSRGNPDTCAALSVPVNIPAKGSKSLTLLMCTASGRGEALRVFLRAREHTGKCGSAPFPSGGAEDVIVQRLLPRLLYRQGAQCEQLRTTIRNNGLRGRGVLWSLGISGDNPVIYVPVDSEGDKRQVAANVTPYLRIAARLANCGLRCDLVIAWQEGGDYAAPLQSALEEQIRREGLENAPFVFRVNTARLTDAEQNALKASAIFIAPQRVSDEIKPASVRPLELSSVKAKHFKNSRNMMPVNGGYFDGDSFCVTTDKPNRPWCWVLANPSFGTLVSSSSLGYTWALNCRENRLTPWENDTCTDNRGERLLAKIDGKTYDLLQGAACRFVLDEVIWQGVAGGIDYSVQLSIPKRGMVKRVRVELDCPEERRLSVVYYTEPVLGVNRAASVKLLGEPLENGALLWNIAGAIPGYAALRLEGGANILCFDRPAFWSGLWHTGELLPLTDNCAAVGRAFTLMPDEKQTLSFSLAWGASRKAALFLLSEQKNEEQSAQGKLNLLPLQAMQPFL